MRCLHVGAVKFAGRMPFHSCLFILLWRIAAARTHWQRKIGFGNDSLSFHTRTRRGLEMIELRPGFQSLRNQMQIFVSLP